MERSAIALWPDFWTNSGQFARLRCLCFAGSMMQRGVVVASRATMRLPCGALLTSLPVTNFTIAGFFRRNTFPPQFREDGNSPGLTQVSLEDMAPAGVTPESDTRHDDF